MSPTLTGYLLPGHRGPLSRAHAAALASAEWGMRDAHAALLCALELNDWAGVRKYTGQVEAFIAARHRLTGGGVTLAGVDGGRTISDLRVD